MFVGCQTLEKQCSPPNHAELEGRSCGDQLQQDWLGQSDGSRRLAEDATQVHKFPAPLNSPGDCSARSIDSPIPLVLSSLPSPRGFHKKESPIR